MIEAPLTPETANAIYDILLAEVEAHEVYREDFVYHFTEKWKGNTAEWRFQGCLGFGGKFWIQHDRWYVNGYREDETPENRRCAARANARLAQLLEVRA
jgi:hypothetical protein